MILKCIIVVSLWALNALGQNVPSADDYLAAIHNFVPSFDILNLFDGPSIVSTAPITTPVNVVKPSRDEIVYYHNYAAAVNCPFGLETMACSGYCPIIKSDIKDFEVLDNSTYGTRGLVTWSEKRKEIVVTFRGSVGFYNTVLDVYFLNTSPDPKSNVKLHRGFYIVTKSLYDSAIKIVATLLLKPEYKNYKLILTGMSMGGAMARITQYFIFNLNQFPGTEIEVYTFGEPRSGNKDYVDFLNGLFVKTARVTHRADLIPHLPPTTTIITDTYHHVLNEYWLNDAIEKYADPTLYEDPTCSMSKGPLYNVLDHFEYFEVNALRCLFGFEVITTLPTSFNPFGFLSALPKFIGATLSDLLKLLSSILG